LCIATDDGRERKIEGRLKKTMLYGPFAGFSSTTSPIRENRQASACYTRRRKSKRIKKYVDIECGFLSVLLLRWEVSTFYSLVLPSPLK
jgi:hypothetical protein